MDRMKSLLPEEDIEESLSSEEPVTSIPPTSSNVVSSQSLWINSCDERLVVPFDVPPSGPTAPYEENMLDMIMNLSLEDQTTDDDLPTTVASDSSTESDLHEFWNKNVAKKPKHLPQGQLLVHEVKKRSLCCGSVTSWKLKVLCVVLLCGIILTLSSLTGIFPFMNKSRATNNQKGMEPLIPSEIPVGAASAPSAQTEPSRSPSETPSTTPSISNEPSDRPSFSPSTSPTIYENEVTTFYAIGDVPYTGLEKIQLGDRMMKLPDNGEFLIHVGDIRSGKNKTVPCRLEEYHEVRDILLHSEIPVFIIPGDNEWNDCPNHEEAQGFWRDTFHEFDKNWNHSFQILRNTSQPENFHFIHKRTLYFGLTLLGGRVRDYSEYSSQLQNILEVVKSTIETHVLGGNVLNVVIFGHAFPKKIHLESFFDPLKVYIEANLNSTVPFMYLGGDKHFYQSEENYMGLSNFHRLQVDSGTRNPPLKVAITSSTSPGWRATEAFAHDRMLSLAL